MAQQNADHLAHEAASRLTDGLSKMMGVDASVRREGD
jgi:hypothetical protein